MTFASIPYAAGSYGGGGAAAVSPEPTSENVLLLSPRASDRATMTASSAVTTLPVRNLQNQEPSKVWRSTSGAAYVDIDFGTARAWNSAAMSAFTLGPAGLWRLKAYSEAADIGGTPALDSGFQSVWPQGFRHADEEWGPEVALLRVENEVAYRNWRVEFVDPGAAYIDVGRLGVGRAAQFSINCDFGNGVGYVPNDIQEPNGWAQIFTDPRPPNRAFTMDFSAQGEREVAGVAAELTRLRGIGGDVFCFLDPGEIELFHKWSMQGLFTGRTDYKSQPVWVVEDDGVARVAWGFSLSLIQKR